MYVGWTSQDILVHSEAVHTTLYLLYTGQPVAVLDICSSLLTAMISLTKLLAFLARMIRHPSGSLSWSFPFTTFSTFPRWLLSSFHMVFMLSFAIQRMLLFVCNISICLVNVPSKWLILGNSLVVTMLFLNSLLFWVNTLLSNKLVSFNCWRMITLWWLVTFVSAWRMILQCRKFLTFKFTIKLEITGAL